MEQQDLFTALQERIPAWHGAQLTIAPLPGGITNRNYKVVAGDEVHVVRVCARNVAIHGIDRQVEQQCNQAAAAAGVAPALLGFFIDLPGDEEVLVTRFVDGATLQAPDVRTPERLTKIARLLRQTHELTTFAGDFDVFRVIRRGLAACRTMNAPLPPFLPDVEVALQQVQTALQQRAAPRRACHNDLLPANFIEDPTGRIWLIDWEYAGWGDPFFDLGNLAVNNEFSAADDDRLLLAYFGEITPTHQARLTLMKMVSDAREGIWGLVQWGISALEFDFADYGARHLARFMQQYHTPTTPTWLQVVQQTSSSE
jgi:thiamine kinase-like enzyme